jgi:uncharacterized protein YjlB
MLREKLQQAGFTLQSQGPEFPNSDTCTVEAFDIVGRDNTVSAERDFAEVKITGMYPHAVGRYALNSLVNETVAVTSGEGTLLLMPPNGFLAPPQRVIAGDELHIPAGTGFQWQPAPGQTLQTELICNPPFTPEQYGYYVFDDSSKAFTLIENEKD